jgi:hypothetical protein
MSLRRHGAALLAVFLAWQTALALADVFAEVTAEGPAERRRALLATEAERIAGALGSWSGVWPAIARHVPEDALVVFLVRPEMPGLGYFFQLRVLGYPRRSVPILQPMTPDELALAAPRAAAAPRPTFLVDVRSGFPVPPGLERVAGDSDFVLWRFPR